MCHRHKYLRLRRLRRLLHESLHLFSDPASINLTEEVEKDFLIALSQVFRQVKQLIDEYDSEEEFLGEPFPDVECQIDAAANLDDRDFLAKITGDLIFLLAINSRYAQHLLGNTLVAISEFLLVSDGDWDAFMQLLCLCLELAICNILKSSPVSELGNRCLDFNPSTKSSLKIKLKSANWSMVAAISRVLRNIQKYLNQDFDNECLTAYLDCVSSLLINLPWDVLQKTYVGRNNEALKGSVEDALLKIEIVPPREITLFFGNFVQLLCSLVTLSGCLEAGLGFSPVFCRITNLVPKLTPWCHTNLQSPYDVRISHYFRHKVLMLMLKLSSSMCIGQTINMTWIHILHKYFEDLLLQPISGGKLDQDGFLEGSPFCTSIFDQVKQNKSSCHLQRLAILLFLKCLLNLDSMKGSNEGQQFMHENLKQYYSSNLNLDSECGSNNTGLTELHKWLQSHVDTHDDELYSERCVRFTLSFLQLFMHEDDILFEVLLQLFNVPSFQGHHRIIEEEFLTEEKNYLVADMFNPIHLFHLFLAEINYDHQVLLDYLISKDTGSSCAEYLLRSLRIICNSWSLFVEFPGVKDEFGQICVKRRKVSADSGDFNEDNYPALSKECMVGHAHGYKSCINYKLPSVAVGECLASLTTSIDSLNKKSLFPYNPQVLLRRLMKFQELSIKQ